ncbi:g8533 [Coccomyxa elongata]
MVLTDLCDEWHLLWLDGSTITQHRFTSRAQAVGFIEDFLADRTDASRGGYPTPERVAKRRKVEVRLMPGAAACVAFEEQMESLEGVIDPSELRQMRDAHMLRQFLDSPCAPSWRDPEEGDV